MHPKGNHKKINFIEFSAHQPFFLYDVVNDDEREKGLRVNKMDPWGAWQHNSWTVYLIVEVQVLKLSISPELLSSVVQCKIYISTVTLNDNRVPVTII